MFFPPPYLEILFLFRSIATLSGPFPFAVRDAFSPGDHAGLVSFFFFWTDILAPWMKNTSFRSFFLLRDPVTQGHRLAPGRNIPSLSFRPFLRGKLFLLSPLRSTRPSPRYRYFESPGVLQDKPWPSLFFFFRISLLMRDLFFPSCPSVHYLPSSAPLWPSTKISRLLPVLPYDLSLPSFFPPITRRKFPLSWTAHLYPRRRFQKPRPHCLLLDPVR